MCKYLRILVFVCLVSDCLRNIRPNAEYNVRGETYGSIEWLDKTQTKPTEQEIDQASVNCTLDLEAKKQNIKQSKLDLNDPNKTVKQRLEAIIIYLGLNNGV